MTADVLKDLLARVEAAPGPDRELDARIFIALDRPAHAAMDDDLIPQPDGLIGIPGHKRALFEAERYTASIDAAVALVRRVLPGAGWDVQAGGCAWIRVDDADIGDAWNLRNSAMALCAALLRAEIARAEDAATG